MCHIQVPIRFAKGANGLLVIRGTQPITKPGLAPQTSAHGPAPTRGTTSWHIGESALRIFRLSEGQVGKR
jgi:hypothetical protein